MIKEVREHKYMEREKINEDSKMNVQRAEYNRNLMTDSDAAGTEHNKNDRNIRMNKI